MNKNQVRNVDFLDFALLGRSQLHPQKNRSDTGEENWLGPGLWPTLALSQSQASPALDFLSIIQLVPFGLLLINFSKIKA
jgi:hypothetical protein